MMKRNKKWVKRVCEEWMRKGESVGGEKNSE